MFEVYYIWQGIERLLHKCDRLSEATRLASCFGYKKYKITSNHTDVCLIGTTANFNVDPDYSFIRWRTYPSQRRGGPKKL